MGLSDSKVCEQDNSRKFFYAFLNMARAGDKLMQLKLLTNLMLHEQYIGNFTIHPMIELDIILAYYYAYLASIQEPNSTLEYTKIYHVMTAQQKKFANRMVKNLQLV